MVFVGEPMARLDHVLPGNWHEQGVAPKRNNAISRSAELFGISGFTGMAGPTGDIYAANEGHAIEATPGR
jgi:hypothetical protein